MTEKMFPPIHPGEILSEEFMKPIRLSQHHLAKEIDVSPHIIKGIVHGKIAISPDIAAKLSRYFRMSEKFWLNLQKDYDLEVESDKFHGKLKIKVTSLKPRVSPNR